MAAAAIERLLSLREDGATCTVHSGLPRPHDKATAAARTSQAKATIKPVYFHTAAGSLAAFTASVPPEMKEENPSQFRTVSSTVMTKTKPDRHSTPIRTGVSFLATGFGLEISGCSSSR